MTDATPTGRPPDAPAATARVGMVGGGQLARMTHRAAIDLGVHLEVLAQAPGDPAVLAGAPHLLGEPDDLASLRALAERVDVVTLDHELVPNDLLVALEDAGHVLRPSAAAVRFAQDKLHQRRELAARGFPVPAFTATASADAVADFGASHGWPVVCKARSGGYDGRGVAIVGDRDSAAAVLARGGEWMAEALVPIVTELAVVVARRPGGEQVVYPVVETLQRAGICHELVQPARVAADVAERAVALTSEVVASIDAVGIVATELFVSADGQLMINELALRPHNSGHATIEACATSQFHNHLRAVLDWPLGATAMRAPVAAMANLLGGEHGEQPARYLPDALAVPGANVHLYGKTTRPGRKLGHVTVLGDDADHALAAARTAADRMVGR